MIPLCSDLRAVRGIEGASLTRGGCRRLGGKEPPVPLGGDVDGAVGHLDGGLVVDRVRRTRKAGRPPLCVGPGVLRQELVIQVRYLVRPEASPLAPASPHGPSPHRGREGVGSRARAATMTAVGDGTVPVGLVARKLVKVVLDNQIGEATACFQDLRTEAWPAFDQWMREQPGSRQNYLRRIWEHGQEMALIVAASGFDHAEALRHSLEDPKGEIRLWPYLTLAQAGSEAFVRSAVLSDRAVSPESSVVRAAAAALDCRLEQVRLARDFAVSDPAHEAPALEESNRAVTEELLRISRAGLLVMRDTKERPLAVVGPTVKASVSLDLTAESNRRLSAIPAPYRIGSAAAHSGSRFLASDVAPGEDGLFRPRVDPNALVTSVVLMLESMSALVASVATEQAVCHWFSAATERRKRLILSALCAWHQRPPKP